MKYGIIASVAAVLLYCVSPVSAQANACDFQNNFSNGMLLAQGDALSPAHDSGGSENPKNGQDGSVMRGQPGGNMYGNLDHFKKRLGLSDEQVAKIKVINNKYTDLYKQEREKMQPKVSDLKKLSKADKIDAVKIKSVYAELVKIQAQSRSARLDHFLEIEQILTSEQSKKIRGDLPFLVEEKMKKQPKGKMMKD